MVVEEHRHTFITGRRRPRREAQDVIQTRLFALTVEWGSQPIFNSKAVDAAAADVAG